MANKLQKQDYKAMSQYIVDLWNGKISHGKLPNGHPNYITPPDIKNKWSNEEFRNFLYRLVRKDIGAQEFRNLVSYIQTKQLAPLIAPDKGYYFTEDANEIQKAIDRKSGYIETEWGTVLCLRKSAGLSVSQDQLDKIEKSINPSDRIKIYAEFVIDVFQSGHPAIAIPSKKKTIKDPKIRSLLFKHDFVNENYNLKNPINDVDYNLTIRWARFISEPGFAILSSSRGYWTSQDRYEIMQTANKKESKLNGMMASINGLENMKGVRKKKNGKLF